MKKLKYGVKCTFCGGQAVVQRKDLAEQYKDVIPHKVYEAMMDRKIEVDGKIIIRHIG